MFVNRHTHASQRLTRVTTMHIAFFGFHLAVNRNRITIVELRGFTKNIMGPLACLACTYMGEIYKGFVLNVFHKWSRRVYCSGRFDPEKPVTSIPFHLFPSPTYLSFLFLFVVKRYELSNFKSSPSFTGSQNIDPVSRPHSHFQRFSSNKQHSTSPASIRESWNSQLSMPSIFSRARTTSTGKKHPSGNPDTSYDEFGRVNSRSSAKDVGGGRSTPSTLVKQKQRTRTLSTPETDPIVHIPDGSFLPFNLEPKTPDNEQQEHCDYGYLSYQRHVVLSLDQVARLVDVVASELGTRALTTPFIFSTLALDVSASSVKRLIRAFLETCTGGADAELRWKEEARLANPHDLGMCIRWGLARVVRVVGGQAVRGLIAWDHYTEFRDSEAGGLSFPSCFTSSPLFTFSAVHCNHSFTLSRFNS